MRQKPGPKPRGAGPRSAAMNASCVCGFRSWPRARTGNRQAVAHIGEVIFEIAIFLGLRLQRDGAHLAVAGDEPAADRPHAAPFGAIDRHGVENSQSRREDLGANALTGVLHVAACAGEVELAATGVEVTLAVR